MQLDIFEHSRDVMLKNDVVGALERRDATGARTNRAALFREYPEFGVPVPRASLGDDDVPRVPQQRDVPGKPWDPYTPPDDVLG